MYAVRTFTTLAVAALVAALSAGAVASPTGTAPLTADDLAYEGATIDVQIDVHGEAAVQLLGGVLDAAAEVAEKQVAAMAAGDPGAAAGGPIGLAKPVIGPATETIKSITQVTALVMKTEETVESAGVMAHYTDLAVGRGWTPMLRLTAEKEVNVAAFLAPEARGVLAVVRPGRKELIVGLITAREPLGDLLAEIVRAGGDQIVPMMLAKGMHQAPPAPESEETCQNTEPAEPTAEAPAG